MGARIIHTGFTIDYTPSEIVLAKSVVVQNDLVGVVNNDIPANRKGALHVKGVFDFTKGAGVITAGTKLYWDATADEATTETSDSSGDFPYVGKSVLDAADADPTVRVLLEQ